METDARVLAFGPRQHVAARNAPYAENELPQCKLMKIDGKKK